MSAYPVGSIGYMMAKDVIRADDPISKNSFDKISQWQKSKVGIKTMCEDYLGNISDTKYLIEQFTPIILTELKDMHVVCTIKKGKHAGKYLDLRAHPNLSQPAFGFKNGIFEEGYVTISAKVKEKTEENTPNDELLFKEKFSWNNHTKLSKSLYDHLN
ncbi:MAG: hypothetical protein JSW73_05040 [Candidatus Woesearchaeota archaeon]|nr:MAG: hypothetical protein JSW73_05040 [Candidatus Woesearchaeota archaeon]